MSDKEIPILTNIADALKAFSDMHPSCLLFLQILGLAYLLVGIAYLTTSFLMRKTVFTSSSHNDISIAVQVNALAMLFPELLLSLLTCLSDRPNMFGFGLGSIVGSGLHDITMCFGLASLFSYKYHNKEIVFHLKPVRQELKVYLASILCLVIILWDFKITLWKALVLTLMTPAYFIYKKQLNQQRASKHKDHLIKGCKYLIRRYNIYHMSAATLLGRYADIPPGDSSGNGSKEQDDKKAEASEQQIDAQRSFQQQFFSPIWQHFAQKLVILMFYPYKLLFGCTVRLGTPILAIATVLIYGVILAKVAITLVDSIALRLSFSHVFMGLTFGTWTMNIGDLVVYMKAAKHMQTESASSDIIGGQILNLHVCLGLPWIIGCIVKGTISFPSPKTFVSLLIVLIMTTISIGLMIVNKTRLNYLLGGSLVSTYFIYILVDKLRRGDTPVLLSTIIITNASKSLLPCLATMNESQT